MRRSTPRIAELTRIMAEEFRPFDYGRFEFRFDAATGELNFLEVNLQCNLWSQKVYGRSAVLAGLTQSQLIETILSEGLRRHGLLGWPAVTRFTVIVLAAQRNGRLDPLAAEAGVTHKCLVPIGGRPLLAHVLDALAARSRASTASGSRSRRARTRNCAPSPRRRACRCSFTPAADNIADSVYAAAEGVTGPIVVTTADNVLLTPYAVGEVTARLAAGDDIVVALARKEDIQAAHPQAQRNFYEFRDGGFSNCNLYGLSQRGLKGAEAFRSGGQFMKNPMRIAHAFGIFNLLLMRFGWVTTERAMQRIGRRFGVTVSRVILADGAHAVDVDNKRTYDIAAELLDRRAA